MRYGPFFDGEIDYLQLSCNALVLFIYIAYVSASKPLSYWIKGFLKAPIGYCCVHLLWYYLDVHKRLGPWGCSETKSHLTFALKSCWIFALFNLGSTALQVMLGLDIDRTNDQNRIVQWEFNEEYKIIKSNSLGEDIFWGIIGFYCIDFLRYWAHRIGHYAFFYKTFPFSHAHHHNQLFVNPITTGMSPLLHFASIATYTPVMLLGALGLHRASIICWFICVVPNYTQHLGCDPLPWLTWINHYYFFGALPWIPLYHAYHHNPFIKTGNFGNTSVLFDYVFGTLQPECVYHIENGRPLDKVLERFKDPQKLDKVINSMYTAGKGKNRLDLNDRYDKSMFKMYLL